MQNSEKSNEDITKDFTRTESIRDQFNQWLKVFIELRLNRDNFWNAFFGLGITFGLTISTLIPYEVHRIVPFALTWFTLFGVPFIVYEKTKIQYIDDGLFINHQGEDITDQLPRNVIGFTLFSSIVTWLVAWTIEPYRDYMYYTLFCAIKFFATFFSLGLYFIIINCPISALLNINVWNRMRIFNNNSQLKEIASHTLTDKTDKKFKFFSNSITMKQYFKILESSCTIKYFDFKTRSNREEYIIFFSNIFFLKEFLMVLSRYSKIMEISFKVITVLAIIPSICLIIRRLHDIDKSGWWYLLIFSVCAIFFLSGYYYKIVDIGMISWATIPIIMMHLFFAIYPSSVGVNKYGLPNIN